MSSEKLDAAIKSIEAGDKTAAMRILASIVTTDPRNEMAWFWLSKCVEENDRKRYCLSRVLAINPNNRDARQELALLESLPQPSFEKPTERTSELSQQSLSKPTTLKTAPLATARKAPPLKKGSSANPIVIVSTVVILVVCILIAVAAIIVNLPSIRQSTSVPVPEKNWYTGGTLHRATVAEWKRATYENKLATAADMAYTTRKGKSAFQNNGIEGVRPYAIDLVNCIDGSTKGNTSYDSSEVALIAAICITMMGWD